MSALLEGQLEGSVPGVGWSRRGSRQGRGEARGYRSCGIGALLLVPWALKGFMDRVDGVSGLGWEKK